MASALSLADSGILSNVTEPHVFEGVNGGLMEDFPYSSTISSLIPLPERRSLFTVRQVTESASDPLCGIGLFLF